MKTGSKVTNHAQLTNQSHFAEPKNLILYDGDCALCNRAVQFTLRHDKQKKFLFAPLEGRTAARIATAFGVDLSEKNSLVLVEDFQSANPKIYFWSQAVFRIGSSLSGASQIPALLRFLPSWMFDWLYCCVARNRQQFFSMSECQLPSPSDKERFLP